MASAYGWTSWGRADWDASGHFRVWKHYTGALLGIHSNYAGDPMLLLSHLNATLEDEADVEHVPTASEKEQQRRDELDWQTFQDIKATAVRLEAENAELRQQLAEHDVQAAQ